MVQLSVRHTPSSRVSSTELTWEMQVSQIAWAPFQCVVKLSCAHTQQRLQKHRDSVLSPGPRCEVKWLINTQTLCNGGPAFPVRGWVDKISVDEVRWGGWGWGLHKPNIKSICRGLQSLTKGGRESKSKPPPSFGGGFDFDSTSNAKQTSLQSESQREIFTRREKKKFLPTSR